MTKPTVFILAAGANTRMFPLNYDHHKAFLTLNGQRLVEHTIENLSQHGFEKIVVVTPNNQDKTEIEELAANSKVNIEIVAQKQALGMGDAILSAKSLCQDQFFVIFPYHTHIGPVLNQMLDLQASTVVCAVKTKTPENYGILKIKDDLAFGLIEKPTRDRAPSDLKIQGAYLLNNQFIKYLENTPQDEYSFEMALNQMMSENPIKLLKLEKELPSLKYSWQLFDFQQVFFNELTSFIHPTANVAKNAVIDEKNGPVYISANAVISHCSRIVGPAFIGEKVMVGDFSLIRQSHLEAGVVVGANTEVVRSILMPQASIHYSYLADSILADEVKIGAGLITANKRLDRKNIQVQVKDQKVDTQTNHLGVIVGARAALGIGVKTMPGVLVAAESKIMPSETIYQHPSD